MYGDPHKYFVQFMLKNSYISVEKALEFCQKHVDEVNDMTTLKTFMSEINRTISKQELKISMLKCEVTGDVKLALLNTANDEISKLQNIFSPIETEYFQLLLKDIIVSDEHKIQNMACFNLTNNLTATLRKDAVEKLLKKLIDEGYLVEKDSYMYLGPRCVVEFAPYFQTHCKDYYTICHLCSELVFTGKCCSSCTKLMHNHCIEKYLAKQNKCPNCKATWQEMEGNANGMHSQDDTHNQDDSSDEDVGPTRRRKTRRLPE